MAEKIKDLYAILEVEPTATDKEIKSAFRKLAKTHHPDKSDAENAQEIFEEIQNAYEVLMDPDSRKEYDEDFKRAKEGSGHISFKDVYSMFHQNKPSTHMPIKGEDVVMELEFTVAEVRQLMTKHVEFERYVNCEVCNGHGFKRDVANICTTCNGKGNILADVKTPFGEIKKEKTCGRCNGHGYANVTPCDHCQGGSGKLLIPIKVSFPLPKETKDGFTIKLREKGDAGINGGKNGDLFVKMIHSKNDVFEMENDFDIMIKLNVPFLTCLTGGTVPLYLPRGETIKLPIGRGTQSGHRIVVPDEGLFNSDNGFYGTLTVVVNVEVPESLPEEKVKKLINILG